MREDSENAGIPLVAERDNKQNLRDRIICALLSLRCDLEEPCEECRILACKDADAVIRALDLGIPCAATGCRMRQIARRHSEASSRLSDSGDAK